jgi:hypothetical protein
LGGNQQLDDQDRDGHAPNSMQRHDHDGVGPVDPKEAKRRTIGSPLGRPEEVLDGQAFLDNAVSQAEQKNTWPATSTASHEFTDEQRTRPVDWHADQVAGPRLGERGSNPRAVPPPAVPAAPARAQTKIDAYNKLLSSVPFTLF